MWNLLCGCICLYRQFLVFCTLFLRNSYLCMHVLYGKMYTHTLGHTCAYTFFKSHPCTQIYKHRLTLNSVCLACSSMTCFFNTWFCARSYKVKSRESGISWQYMIHVYALTLLNFHLPGKSNIQDTEEKQDSSAYCRTMIKRPKWHSSLESLPAIPSTNKAWVWISLHKHRQRMIIVLFVLYQDRLTFNAGHF